MSRNFALVNNDKCELGSALVSTPGITIAAWIKSNGVATTGVEGIIAGVVTNAANNHRLTLSISTGGAIQAVSRDTGANSASSSASISETTNWHHAAAVWTANNSRAAFLDGANKGTDTNSRTPSGMNRTIVGLGGDANFDLYGKVAHVGIWNVALSDGDIATLAGGANPQSVQLANLVAYWTLDTNASPEDDVIGANDLTVTTATYSSDNPTVSAFSASSIVNGERSHRGMFRGVR